MHYEFNLVRPATALVTLTPGLQAPPGNIAYAYQIAVSKEARLTISAEVVTLMKYAVLRDLQQTRISSEDWLRPGLRQYDGTSSGPVPVPRVDVEETDAKGAYELAREPGVVAAEPVMPLYLIEPVGIGEPTALGNSWGVEAVGAVESDYTGADTVVAVLDTGIDAAHPAFAGMTIIEKDFSGSGNGDTQGHGTHCAGTIVGRDVNGDRIGIARGVQRILVGKVFDDSGAGSSEMLFTALQWAVANHARVVSMSLGFDFTGMVSQQVQEGWPADLATSLALELYRRNLRMFDALMAMIRAQEGANPGCVVVAAAGNESKRDIKPDYQIAVSLPAAADGVLSIGAVGRSPDGYVIAPFSNSNPRLCAPGVDIKSASPGGGLCIKSGTSMACPHTAGVAALWWEAAREMGLPFNAKTVIARIEASCRLDGLKGVSALDRGQGMVSAP